MKFHSSFFKSWDTIPDHFEKRVEKVYLGIIHDFTVVLLSYKFRMYPTPNQERILDTNLELCRSTYNRILTTIKDEKQKGHKINKAFTQNLLPKWKKSDPDLKSVYSKTLQMVNHQVWSNILGLFKLKKNGYRIGRLRYKSSGSYKTLNYNQSGFEINEQANRIHFSKIGNIRTIIHRPMDGMVKGIIIKRTGTNKWYALVQIEKDEPPLPETRRKVGLDVGISKFVTDSDKKEFEYPKNIDKTLDKLIKQQRELSRKKKGSYNYRKAKLNLAITHEILEHQRRDYLHKISTYYIRNYDLIAHEDLDIKNMLRNRKSKTLNRHILDASWGTFFKLLENKAERADRRVEKVPPKNTTQKCSICKIIVPKTLKDRIHKCPCGHEVPRDYNSAQNVLFDAYSHNGNLGQGMSPTLAEKNPLLSTFSYKEIVDGKIFR